MTHANLETIDQFFAAYAARDHAGLRKVTTEHIRWTFPGNNPLSGVRSGLEAVVAFFNVMGTIMGSSNVQVEKLIVEANEDYVVEVQHISTHREDGNDLDHLWCVLWKFEGGKIAEGRHLAADQYAVDEFFSKVRR